jgi:hypothetical protein
LPKFALFTRKGGNKKFPIVDQFHFSQFFSTILEILLYKNKHNMISEARIGYREKSNNTATQTFTEGIQKALDSKLLVIGIFLDLTNAFDVINLLLATLELYGLREKNTLMDEFISYW